MPEEGKEMKGKVRKDRRIVRRRVELIKFTNKQGT